MKVIYQWTQIFIRCKSRGSEMLMAQCQRIAILPFCRRNWARARQSLSKIYLSPSFRNCLIFIEWYEPNQTEPNWTESGPSQTKQKKQLLCVSDVVLNCLWTMFCAHGKCKPNSLALQAFKLLHALRKYTYKMSGGWAALAHQHFNQNPFFPFFFSHRKIRSFHSIFVDVCCLFLCSFFFFSFFNSICFDTNTITITPNKNALA